MSIKAIVCNISHSALVPTVHVLVTSIDSSVIKSVPMDLGCFSIEEVRLIFDGITVKGVMTWIDEIVCANLIWVPNVLVHERVLLRRRRSGPGLTLFA